MYFALDNFINDFWVFIKVNCFLRQSMFCVIHINYVFSIWIEQGQKGDIGPPGPPGLVSFSLKSSYHKFNIAS